MEALTTRGKSYLLCAGAGAGAGAGLSMKLI